MRKLSNYVLGVKQEYIILEAFETITIGNKRYAVDRTVMLTRVK